MGSHWVLFLLYLNIVLIWPEDGRLRPKHAAKHNLILIIASCLDVCCVLTVYNTLHKYNSHFNVLAFHFIISRLPMHLSLLLLFRFLCEFVLTYVYSNCFRAKTRRECRPLSINVVLHNRNPAPPTAFSWIPVPVASDEREIEPRTQFHFGTALAVHLEVLVDYLT